MTTIFFSYSHADETLRDELEKHLSMLKRQGKIDAWHDRRIPAGDVLDQAISDKLEAANVVLLLISPDFLASRYCYDVEMQRAMERHERGECRVIAVILRPCDWKETPFAKLLVTPTDGRPVTRWPDRDEAFLDVVTQIKAALPKQAAAQQIAHSAVTSAIQQAVPRSSNLRLRKEFTEADKDRFLDEAFEFIRRFFENSLAELQNRHPGIQTRFRPIDAQAFGAVIYKNGTAVARCGIRNGGRRGFGGGISYVADENAPANSMNEWLSVEADEQSLFLKAGGMAMMIRGERKAHLTPEGAAEYYWEMLMEPLQR